jgi:hypothetical protein
MEVKSTRHSQHGMVPFLRCVGLIIFLLWFGNRSVAQWTPAYTIKNGNMLIILGKDVRETALDSFIGKFELFDLDLRNFVKSHKPDSLNKLGWNVQFDKELGYLLTKPLLSNKNINYGNPENKIMLTEKASFAERFPIVSNRVKFGNNRFRNKHPFAIKDSFVTFFLRGNLDAQRVSLSGSFNDWVPEAWFMRKTDSGWIYSVKLAVGKYWYKFLINGGWTTDRDNLLVENDGLGNDNSVYFKPNMVFTLKGFTDAKKVVVSGSFNDWKPNDLVMNKTVDGWQLPLYLADGTHTYRYVIDGQWREDPDNPDHYPNELGEYNSVIRVGKPYIFKLDGYQDAKQVVLSGSFNKWRRNELYMKKTATGWEFPYTLGPGNYEYKFIIDDKFEAHPGNVNVKNGDRGNLYFVIEPNYTFRLKGFPNAKKVYLTGDFNNWSPNTFVMTRQGDEWVFAANLTPGKHTYKFVVDGKWIIDPGNKLWEQNEFGTGNSVLWLGQ